MPWGLAIPSLTTYCSPTTIKDSKPYEILLLYGNPDFLIHFHGANRMVPTKNTITFDTSPSLNSDAQQCWKIFIYFLNEGTQFQIAAPKSCIRSSSLLSMVNWWLITIVDLLILFYWSSLPLLWIENLYHSASLYSNAFTLLCFIWIFHMPCLLWLGTVSDFMYPFWHVSQAFIQFMDH